MDAPPATPTATDVAGELSAWMVGLGILTMMLFPFAIPLLVLVIAPIALIALAGLLLAAPFILAFWLVRSLLRTRSRRATAQSPGQAAPATSNAGPTRSRGPAPA